MPRGAVWSSFDGLSAQARSGMLKALDASAAMETSGTRRVVHSRRALREVWRSGSARGRAKK